MIRDYSVYTLSEKEKAAFYLVGFMCLFTVSYMFYHSIAAACVFGVLIRLLRPQAEKVMADRRRAKLNLQFKDMLYSLSASAASGRHMAEGLVEAEEALSLIYDDDEPIMIELRHMKKSIVENKESDKVLLQDFADRSHSEDIDNFVQVYITCRSMGGNLEKIICHTTDVLTDKMNIEREVRVLTNQRKTEGRIISAMPLVMLLAMNVVSYSYIEPLYTTPAGRAIMSGALIVMACGICLMEKISSVEV